MLNAKYRRGLPRAQSRGFTIIELLVVISIIAILAGLIIVNVTKARSRGRDAKRIADLSTIQLAVEQYRDAKGGYPNSTSGCWLEVKPGATNCGGAPDSFSNKVQSYLSPLPEDPIKKSDDLYRYEINIPSTVDRYWIRARMEDESSKNAGEICYYVIGGNITAGQETNGSTDPVCKK